MIQSKSGGKVGPEREREVSPGRECGGRWVQGERGGSRERV